VVELEGSRGARRFPVEMTAHMSEVGVRYIVTDLDCLEDPSGNPVELFEPARRS
jgi:hypothetical protein